MQRSMSSLVSGLLALAFLLTPAACDDGRVSQVSKRSTTKVVLPKKPELRPREYTKTHKDGALTVEGVLRHRNEYLDREVSVRGKVLSVTKCPEPPPPPPPTPEELKEKDKELKRLRRAGQEPPPPPPPPRRPRSCNPRPHAYLVDADSDQRYRLLVAGSMWSELEHFELGTEVTLKGRFVIVSEDGHYLRQTGLLLLPDLPPPEPPAPKLEEG